MKKQKGYIKIVLVVFAILIGIMIFPFKTPPPAEKLVCSVGMEGNREVIQLAEPGLGQSTYFADTEEYLYWDTPNPDSLIDYVQIRTNVLATMESSTPKWTFLGPNPPTGKAHSIRIGEVPERPGYDVYYPTSAGEIDMPEGKMISTWTEGLVYFVNNDPSTMRYLDGKTLYSVDVYQRKTIHDEPRGYKTEELFPCIPGRTATPPEVVFPQQNVSEDKKQLQLEWFLLRSGTYWGVHCKPAVYLYPERKQLVNVKVFPKGQLSYTDPPYDSVKGWTVEANPDGRLYEALSLQSSAVRQYDYLYYESKILDSEIKKPVKGWVVKFDEMEGLYNSVLPKLGLNQKEAHDFSEYWLKTLPESPYYFVGLMDKGQRDYLEPLSVTPRPDTSIRFSLYFEPLEQLITLPEPEIHTPERNGFTLVDWGGMVKLHPGTSFTCSQ